MSSVMVATTAQWEVPTVLAVPAQSSTYESQWAVFAAVAALLGLPIAVVAYICGTCQARSFSACVSAVRKYFGPGC